MLGPDVRLEGTALRKGLVAVGAGIGLGPRVRAEVCREGALLCKALGTRNASKRSLARVDALVPLQVRLLHSKQVSL